MKGNEHTIRTMQSHEVAVRSEPVRRSGRLRKPPWRHRVGLGGRDKSKIGTLNKQWLSRTSIVVAFFLISSILYITSNRASDIQGKYESDGNMGRSLLSNESGGHVRPPWETCSFESVNQPVLWVIFYAIFVIILFIAIAIICDDFFVPSLEVISETLSLSEDVAGATFMAAGSSAPELFTAVIGVAFESDVGVGTIVGSAVFNILIIIALTAALAGQVLNLDWRPLTRDSFFYGLSLVCFIVFSWDTEFTWWESLILVILYVIYLVLMKVNPKIMEKTKHVTCGGFCRNEVAPLDAEAGEAVGETEVQTVTDGTETPGQNGTANGNALPRKLPPLQSHPSEENRKISVLSNQSLAVPGNNHIFHHVKHGELSSNFTSSSYDLRKLTRDTDSRLGSRPNSAQSTALSSRPDSGPDSQASLVNNNNTNTIAFKGDANANNNNIPMVTKTNGSIGNHQHGVVPTVVASDGRMNVNGDLVVGDVESLGGDSQGDFGSQTQLLSVPGKGNAIMRDNDSGIHSAHGNTPVIPESSSDPSSDSSDPKRRQSLVDGLNHPHHHHHHEHDGDHKPHDVQAGKEEEEDTKSEVSEEEPTLRPLPCLPAINMYYPDKEILESTCGCLRYSLKWVLFVISFPFMCAFTWTIPNCSVPRLRKWYVASFLLSIFWIAALSFGMVTLVVKMGCILKISDYTMGLVIVAVGTSVPDALSSILVARDGYGDMAVSNAIGSNVFDINLGIGLPYLIRIAINGGTNIALLNAADQIRFDNGAFGPIPPHAKFGFILLLILLLTIIAFTAVRFRLNAVIGVSFAIMYVLFMVYAFVQEIVCDGGC